MLGGISGNEKRGPYSGSEEIKLVAITNNARCGDNTIYADHTESDITGVPTDRVMIEDIKPDYGVRIIF